MTATRSEGHWRRAIDHRVTLSGERREVKIVASLFATRRLAAN